MIYYAADKKRVPVEISEELLTKTRQAIVDAKALAASGHCPPPLKNDARCLGCSAYPICLPNESLWWAKRRKATTPEGQLQFGFTGQSEDALRDRISEAASVYGAHIAGLALAVAADFARAAAAAHNAPGAHPGACGRSARPRRATTAAPDRPASTATA